MHDWKVIHVFMYLLRCKLDRDLRFYCV